MARALQGATVGMAMRSAVMVLLAAVVVSGCGGSPANSTHRTTTTTTTTTTPLSDAQVAQKLDLAPSDLTDGRWVAGSPEPSTEAAGLLQCLGTSATERTAIASSPTFEQTVQGVQYGERGISSQAQLLNSSVDVQSALQTAAGPGFISCVLTQYRGLLRSTTSPSIGVTRPTLPAAPVGIPLFGALVTAKEQENGKAKGTSLSEYIEILGMSRGRALVTLVASQTQSAFSATTLEQVVQRVGRRLTTLTNGS